MTEYCRFHPAIPLPCSPCSFDDLYKPEHYGKTDAERKSIESWGALHWHGQTIYWMDKYIAAEKRCKDLRDNQV